jgi:hypothetical protein
MASHFVLDAHGSGVRSQRLAGAQLGPLLIDLFGDELQELRVVLEVFHDNPLETRNLVRSISIHGVASPAGDQERAQSVERDS